jgi:hypothetical protein
MSAPSLGVLKSPRHGGVLIGRSRCWCSGRPETESTEVKGVLRCDGSGRSMCCLLGSRLGRKHRVCDLGFVKE